MFQINSTHRSYEHSHGVKLLTKPGCFHTNFHGLVKALLRGRGSGEPGPRIAADLQRFSNLMMMMTAVAVAMMMNRVVVDLQLIYDLRNGVLATVHG